MSNEYDPPDPSPLSEGVDYIIENGRWVFTRAYHLKRGYCCGTGCRNCPFEKTSCEGAGHMPNLETCPGCQAQFDCHPGQCWCDSVVVSLEALVDLRQNYEGCLCPECLQKAAEHREQHPE